MAQSLSDDRNATHTTTTGVALFVRLPYIPGTKQPLTTVTGDCVAEARLSHVTQCMGKAAAAMVPDRMEVAAEYHLNPVQFVL
jgi:hypothetical protein